MYMEIICIHSLLACTFPVLAIIYFLKHYLYSCIWLTNVTLSYRHVKRAMVFFQVVLFLCFTVDSIMLIKVRKRKRTRTRIKERDEDEERDCEEEDEDEDEERDCKVYLFVQSCSQECIIPFVYITCGLLFKQPT